MQGCNKKQYIRYSFSHHEILQVCRLFARGVSPKFTYPTSVFSHLPKLDTTFIYLFTRYENNDGKREKPSYDYEFFIDEI